MTMVEDPSRLPDLIARSATNIEQTSGRTKDHSEIKFGELVVVEPLLDVWVIPEIVLF